MTESAPDYGFSPSPPPPERRKRLRWLPSLVWLIPLAAAIVGLSLLIHSLSGRGPEVTVSFRTAEGLTPGKTPVRYKAVDIGLVKSVRLLPDRSQVIATIALTEDARSFAAKDTRFWIVRPRFAASGISGLETMLSGAYISVDAGKSEESARAFSGLEEPPAVSIDAPGRQFVLRAADLGSLDIGSPVYYRRMQVGQVVAYQLDSNGRDISLRVFVNEPYDKLVSADTRFWHASGVDVKLDASGFKINTQSLATVLLGGVAFQTPDGSPLTAAADDRHPFVLAADQGEAMKAPEEMAPTLAVLNFDQSVRGLSPGAPLDFRGIVVGQVRSIGMEYQRDKKSFRLPVVVELYPSRMGFGRADLEDKQSARMIAESMNKRGLRAQLRTGNLLTGQLYVAFDFFPKARPVKVNFDRSLPELPTTPSTIDEYQAKLGDIINSIHQVPFAQIGQDLRTTMAALEAILHRADQMVEKVDGEVVPQVSAALQEARQTLQTANGALAADAPLPQEARRMMREMTQAAASLRALSDFLERHPEALVRGKIDTEMP